MRNGNFETSQWMKKLLDEPTHFFNTSAPSYQEISNIIKKMNSGSSACPFDQVSIIILKRRQRRGKSLPIIPVNRASPAPYEQPPIFILTDSTNQVPLFLKTIILQLAVRQNLGTTFSLMQALTNQ